MAPDASSQNFGTTVNWNTSFPTYPSANQSTYSTYQPTYPSTNPPTYPFTNPPTYPPTNPPTYSSTYQSNPAPVASATNPFFGNTQQQQAPPPAQNWSNQFQMQAPARPVNSGGLPSTNPFNVSIAGNILKLLLLPMVSLGMSIPIHHMSFNRRYLLVLHHRSIVDFVNISTVKSRTNPYKPVKSNGLQRTLCLVHNAHFWTGLTP